MNTEELIIDSFAGGGGASLGIYWGTGRHPDMAINHDVAAIAMHAANHPATKHFTEDVWKVSPRKVTRGRPVGLLWASPDCKHFSRAKGGKPVEKRIRSLAWVVCKWASEVGPRVIILENVREFEDWGPLLPRWMCRECEWKGTEGQTVLIRKNRKCPRCDSRRLIVTEDMIPDPKRKGLTFRRFVGRLRNCGYVVAWKVLNAADYGAPTQRRRLFLIARNDGEQIVWPEPTHGDPKKIGSTEGLWSDDRKPWRTAAECIDWSIPCPSIFDRKKPLAEKTMRRIALGIKRYVLENPRPFIVGVGGRDGQSPATDINAPIGTITAKNDRAVVTPFIAPLTHTGERRSHPMTEPLPTVTSARRGEFAMIAPTLINCAYGSDGRWGDGTANLGEPIKTIHSGGKNFALVAAFLAKHFGGVVGVPLDTPLPTTTTRGTQNQVVAAKLIHLNNNTNPTPIDGPLHTITSGGGHAALVYSFLVKYFGTAIGQHLFEPLHTATSKARFGLVTVSIDGEPYVIVDIGMRMLTPRELARGQGFSDDYILTGTNTDQVARIGNSVPPVMAKVLSEANCTEAVEV